MTQITLQFENNSIKNRFLKIIELMNGVSVVKPHILSGKYAGIWECHIKPDWLLL